MTTSISCLPCVVIERSGMHILADMMLPMLFLVGIIGLFFWPLMFVWLIIPLALAIRGIAKLACSVCRLPAPPSA